MTAKPQNLLRSLLLIPYVAWGISLPFAYLVSAAVENSYTTNTFFDVIAGVVTFYTIGIFLWGVPYTILAVGLLVWSIHKPAPTIYKLFFFSPFFLSILMVIEIALVSFWPPQALSHETVTEFLSSILVVVIPSLIFGYSLVVVGAIIYKIIRILIPTKTEGVAK